MNTCIDVSLLHGQNGETTENTEVARICADQGLNVGTVVGGGQLCVKQSFPPQPVLPHPVKEQDCTGVAGKNLDHAPAIPPPECPSQSVAYIQRSLKAPGIGHYVQEFTQNLRSNRKPLVLCDEPLEQPAGCLVA